MLHHCREQTLSFVQLPGQVPSTLESHPHDLSRMVTTSAEEVSQGLVVPMPQTSNKLSGKKPAKRCRKKFRRLKGRKLRLAQCM